MAAMIRKSGTLIGARERDEEVSFCTGTREDLIEQIRGRGVDVGLFGKDDEERAALLTSLEEMGGRVRNGGSSVSSSPISPSCVACTADCGSETFFISLRCHRRCFFCFNPNQQGYEHYLTHDRPWRDEFDRLEADRRAMTHIGLTGGEPLLEPEKALDFLGEAHRRWPEARLRLYTAGDQLTPQLLEKLASRGLSEIRISIKPDDVGNWGAPSFRALELCCTQKKRLGLLVLVEMPVFPGTYEAMRELLLHLDEMGVDGINLLELCYPFGDWGEFARRGLRVRNPPFAVPYDYVYAGALPIEGSEAECLRLVRFALERKLGLSAHSCSLANKHIDQILSQNRRADPGACYLLSPDDGFYHAVRAYGEGALAARDVLSAVPARDWSLFEEDGSLVCHPRHTELLLKASIATADSLNIVEDGEGALLLREVMLCPLN